jgi:arsenate reductase
MAPIGRDTVPPMTLAIWHNPSCSKSREALKLIVDAGVVPHVRLYLEDPPSPAELAETLALLGLEPWELARMGEPLARETGLTDLVKDEATHEEWIRIMCANPKLIERPVVISDDGRAVVGRPPESVQELLS